MDVVKLSERIRHRNRRNLYIPQVGIIYYQTTPEIDTVLRVASFYLGFEKKALWSFTYDVHESYL